MGYVFRVYLECADLSALWFAGRTARCFSYAILKQSGNKLPHSKGFAKTLNRYWSDIVEFEVYPVISSENVQRGGQVADRSRTISNLTGCCTS